MVAFSSLARNLGEGSTINYPPALFSFFSFFFFFFFFFKVEISSRTLLPLFMPLSVHSGSETARESESNWILTSCKPHVGEGGEEEAEEKR